MKELKGTKTEQNLKQAFVGETEAYTKYQYYASKAKKEGYEQLASIFEETAGNEKEHAKIWFKYLHGNQIPTTTENLKEAANGENYEHTNMYARMAAEARAEGFTEIALRFEMVGKVEAEHEERYLTILQSIENKKVFLKEGEVAWKCRNCGHIHIGKQAPVMCPLCAHPQGYFEVMSKNY